MDYSGNTRTVTASVTVSAQPAGIGDVTIDGVIDLADARAILRYIAGTETFTDEQKALADVNGDGGITSADAQRLLAGFEEDAL